MKKKTEEIQKLLKKLVEDYDIANLEMDLSIKEGEYQKYLNWLKETRSKPQVFDKITPVKPIQQQQQPEKPKQIIQNPQPNSKQNIAPKSIPKEEKDLSDDDTHASTNITTQSTYSSDDDTKKKKKKEKKENLKKKGVEVIGLPLDEKVEEDFFEDEPVIAKDQEVQIDKGFYDEDDDEEKDSSNQMIKDST